MNSKLPLVSVVLPTYNRAPMLDKAIQSVVDQTYTNWELLIVDDGSQDNTREVLTKWSEIDRRIKHLSPGRNQGASAARNYGIDRAVGKFITFIDSDDQYDPGKIKAQVEKFLNLDTRVGVLTCGRRDFNTLGVVYKEWVPGKRGDLRKNMFRDERIGAGTPFLMVRREVIDTDVRFDKNINVVEDFDFLMQILQKGYLLDFVPAPLVNVYHHEGIERNFSYERAFDAREYLYNKYASVLKSERKTRDLFLFKTMIFYTMIKESKPDAHTLRDFISEHYFFYKIIQLNKWLPKGYLKNASIRFTKLLFN